MEKSHYIIHLGYKKETKFRVNRSLYTKASNVTQLGFNALLMNVSSSLLYMGMYGTNILFNILMQVKEDNDEIKKDLIKDTLSIHDVKSYIERNKLELPKNQEEIKELKTVVIILNNIPEFVYNFLLKRFGVSQVVILFILTTHSLIKQDMVHLTIDPVKMNQVLDLIAKMLGGNRIESKNKKSISDANKTENDKKNDKDYFAYYEFINEKKKSNTSRENTRNDSTMTPFGEIPIIHNIDQKIKYFLHNLPENVYVKSIYKVNKNDINNVFTKTKSKKNGNNDNVKSTNIKKKYMIFPNKEALDGFVGFKGYNQILKEKKSKNDYDETNKHKEAYKKIKAIEELLIPLKQMEAHDFRIIKYAEIHLKKYVRINASPIKSFFKDYLGYNMIKKYIGMPNFMKTPELSPLKSEYYDFILKSDNNETLTNFLKKIKNDKNNMINVLFKNTVRLYVIENFEEKVKKWIENIPYDIHIEKITSWIKDNDKIYDECESFQIFPYDKKCSLSKNKRPKEDQYLYKLINKRERKSWF